MTMAMSTSLVTVVAGQITGTANLTITDGIIEVFGGTTLPESKTLPGQPLCSLFIPLPGGDGQGDQTEI